MMKVKKLKNGMRVHLVPFSGTDAVTLLVLTKVGSRYENDKVWGGSHFIEHLMFKGTKRRPNTIDISKTLDRYGAQFNAYTGKDITGYYVKIAGDKIEVAVDLLHDMIYHSLYDSKEMDKERKVIIEELKMYEENPIMHLEDLLERAMFAGSRLGLDIVGSEKSMMEMKREDLIEYRDKYYVPSETVVVVSGNVPKDIMSQLEKTFGTVKSGIEPESYVPFGDTPERDTPRIEIQTKDLKQIQISLGFPAPGKHSEDVPVVGLLSNILGGAMSSRLFIEVRERRGLCYTVRSSYDSYEDVGIFSIRAGLDAERLEEAMKTIIHEVNKITKEGVTDEELQYAKDSIEGASKLAMENSSARAEFVGRQELFLKEVQTLEEKMEQIRAVTKDDIQKLAQDVLNFKKMSIACIGPYKNNADLLKYFPKI